ncbi:hypothetical protein BC629DRAFT_2282 [Irpex lacteus]|nr:hypothetical protein BC629DRAFT_2282 [Irpex lacteus]
MMLHNLQSRSGVLCYALLVSMIASLPSHPVYSTKKSTLKKTCICNRRTDGAVDRRTILVGAHCRADCSRRATVWHPSSSRPKHILV